MTRQERVTEVFNYLRRNALIHTQKDLAEKMATTPQNVSKALSGSSAVLTDNFFRRLNAAFDNPFNSDWLLNGDGTMLRTDGTLPPSCVHDYGDTYVGALISANDVGIPYYDIEPASCGSLSGFGEAFTANNIAAHIVLPNMTAKKGDIFIKTKGRSMVDYEHPELSIPDGAIVLIREWTESYIAWGELYCVMTRSGYAVKRLMPGADDAHVSCVSADAAHYPAYTIALTDIVGIARVIGILTYKTV